MIEASTIVRGKTLKERIQSLTKPRRNVKRVSSPACSISSSPNPNKNLSLNKRSLKKSKMNKIKKKKLIYLIMRTTIKMLRSIIILLQCLGSYNYRHKMMTQIILLLTEKSRVLIKSLLTSKNSTSCNKEKIIRPRFLK